jgi:hypothetical protein
MREARGAKKLDTNPDFFNLSAETYFIEQLLYFQIIL